MLADILARCLFTGFPCRMIDILESIEKDRSITARKLLSANEPYFAAHFPGFPVMPGVLMLETFLQAATVLEVYSQGWAGRSDLVGVLVACQRAKYKKPILVGDVLVIQVEQKSRKKRFVEYTGMSFVDGDIVSEISFTATIAKRAIDLPPVNGGNK